MMMPVRLIVLVFFLFSAAGVLAQNKPQKMAEKTRLLFLVDASGSMLDPWGGRNQTKLSVAKSILTKIVDSLRRDNKIELALRLYGHKFPPGVGNCQDTDLEVPFRANNHQQIINRINSIQPKGVTPISYSLEQSANDFPPQSSGYRNLIILITDGIESCGGDPCATSAALQKKGVFLQPYIIGLGMRAEKSLECAGMFLNADTPGKFYDLLNEAIEKSFAKTTVSVLLQGPNQKPVTNVNVSFVNAVSGVSQYEFVNYLDARNIPDSVQVDPLVKYNLVVSTLPPIVRNNVDIEQGGHTRITIPVAQGNLVIRQDGAMDKTIKAIVRQPGKSETLQTQGLNQSVQYLAGDYEVELLSMPRRTYQVKIAADKTFTLHIPTPGTVNVNTIGTGYGALYEIKSDGSQVWVTSLDNLRGVFNLNLLPGKYKIVFRVKNSPGSKYTAYKQFEVVAGRTHQINVFDP